MAAHVEAGGVHAVACKPMHSLKPPYHITFGSVSIFNVPGTAMTASSRQGIFRENVWGGQTATAEGRETRGARVGVARAWVWGRAWVWPCIALPCVAGRTGCVEA